MVAAKFDAGGRASTGGGGKDRRRRPSFNGRRRRARLGARESAREVGELGVSEGGRGEALGALKLAREGRGGGSRRAWHSMAMRP
jgi:hypothetical protein